MDLCESSVLTKEIIKMQQKEIEQQQLNKVITIFKVLADETRLKIVYILSENENLCVCDVAQLVKCSIATASHHLRTLKSKGLAKSVKKGKQVLYSIDDEHVRQLVQIGIIHQKEVEERGK